MNMISALREHILGDILIHDDILRFYSVDASSYQIIPKVVVVPKNQNDVVAAVKTARLFHSSVTARGAGTGIVGNSLNDGIILDMKNLDSIEISEDHAIVGPGASKGVLDEKLRRHGKFFPPNPSVGRYCTIGGMLGNNASGSKSLKYGSTIDNVLEITFVDGNGDVVTLPRDLHVGKGILELAKKINRNNMPNVTKNSSGYRLDHIITHNDTHKAIIGSEGTLGIITSARLKILDIPEKRVLYILEYASASDAAKDCPDMLKTGPAAVEFVDVQTLRDFEIDLDGDSVCLLFVEYDDHTGKADWQMRRTSAGKITRIDTEYEILKWWRLRDLSLYRSIESSKSKNRFPDIIEDVVVPVENLSGLFDLLEEVAKRFQTGIIIYGHAGNGNIHTRLIADTHAMERINEIAKYYFERVINMGGSISGEHGDGLARTRFVRKQYGKENYNLFTRLKNMLDPDGVLNPGKTVSCIL